MAQVKCKRIALIGAMGSGKTTLAKSYAARFCVSAFDTDEQFTRRYGEISAYFDAYGEEEFRKRERELIQEAVISDARIISCGGGAVLDKKSMSLLRRSCVIVLLTADNDTLSRRIKNSDRPLRSRADEINRERARLYYGYADAVLDTSAGGDLSDDLHNIALSPRKNRYDFLLCDADDTVLDYQASMRHCIVKAARAVGIKCSDEYLIARYKEVSDDIWGRLEKRAITHDELNDLRFKLLRASLDEYFDADLMNDVYFSEMKKTRFTIDGATSFLARVRARGIKVYIITNAFENIARERLKALDGFTDGAFVSETLGYDKPDKRFFDRVFGDIGCTDLSRVLVFGDSVTSDIAGGINAGADTCLFDVTGKKESAADYSVSSYAELDDIL